MIVWHDSVASKLVIGVGKGCWPSPPSEPDVRVSRIRLSGWWFYLRED
jgi:hypothetical protein